ncbi:hypothetical protein L9G16_00620 [Shewanella sp. A25]|nr:hypothetical protein [Shewanella shenzhenensis]
MRYLGRLALLALGSLVLIAKAHAIQPIIVSYAVQPVSHFNQTLKKAQAEHQAWSDNPAQISSEYAGKKFTLVRTQPNKNGMLTYQLSEMSAQHPQMLLIMSLKKNAKLWQVDSAQLAWKCREGQHFGTERCNIQTQDTAY